MARKKNIDKNQKDLFAEVAAKTETTTKKRAPFKGSLQDCLAQKFSGEEAQKVLKILQDLQLPLPQSEAEFMAGTEGAIIFINRYGSVIRIEEKNELRDINDSQWVLQPLARFETGKAVVEICPACAFESKKENYELLKKGLEKDGLKMWDSGLRQTGRMPVKTPEFPNGMPVVVDRQAVRKLSESAQSVKNDLQTSFYRPLREKIASARMGDTLDARKVREFWQLCEEFVRDGKLVTGWNNYQRLYDNGWEYKTPEGPKALQAAEKAKAYEARLTQKSFKQDTPGL